MAVNIKEICMGIQVIEVQEITWIPSKSFMFTAEDYAVLKIKPLYWAWAACAPAGLDGRRDVMLNGSFGVN